MLRMGKSQKAEPADQERGNTQYQQQYNAQPSYAAYQTPEAARADATELPNTVTRAVTESDGLARDIKDGKLTGYVGNGTVVTGEATFKGMLRVDGKLSGRVTSEDGTLLVGTNGQVDADIEVAIATINGTVNGDIIATERLEMGRAAHVNGNIQTPSLMIEQGAVFEGSCRMIQQKETQEKQREARMSGNSGKKAYEAEAITPQVENVSDVAS